VSADAAQTASPEGPSSSDGLFCPQCGYDLRGTESDQCAECGFALDRARLVASRIPWVHRKYLGWRRAYERTNFLVLFKPAVLAEEMSRPVDYKEARRFRYVTVLMAAVPLDAWAIALFLTSGALRDFPQGNALGWILEGVCAITGIVAIWLFLLGASGSGSYFFHPRRMSIAQQNRAIAVSCYGCAPLAWAWLPAGLLALARLIMNASRRPNDLALQIAVPLYAAGFGLAAIVVILWWARTVNLMRGTTQCGIPRTLLFAIYLPLSWAVLLWLCTALVTGAVFISVVILSL
jgi:hypothetical protein